MKGCALKPFETGGTAAVDLGWYHELAGGGQIAHRLVYQPTEATPQYPTALLFRLLCHYLVDSVPEQAIPELADAALSIFDQYSVPRTSVVFSSLERQHVPAATGRVFASAPFYAEPD